MTKVSDTMDHVDCFEVFVIAWYYKLNYMQGNDIPYYKTLCRERNFPNVMFHYVARLFFCDGIIVEWFWILFPYQTKGFTRPYVKRKRIQSSLTVACIPHERESKRTHTDKTRSYVVRSVWWRLQQQKVTHYVCGNVRSWQQYALAASILHFPWIGLGPGSQLFVFNNLST